MRPPDRFDFMTDARLQQEAMVAGLGGMALVTFIAGSLGASPIWWGTAGWFAGSGPDGFAALQADFEGQIGNA
jgi:hypothetical protein